MIFQKKIEVVNWKFYRKVIEKLSRYRYNLLNTGGDLTFLHLV